WIRCTSASVRWTIAPGREERVVCPSPSVPTRSVRRGKEIPPTVTFSTGAPASVPTHHALRGCFACATTFTTAVAGTVFSRLAGAGPTRREGRASGASAIAGPSAGGAAVPAAPLAAPVGSGARAAAGGGVAGVGALPAPAGAAAARGGRGVPGF